MPPEAVTRARDYESPHLPGDVKAAARPYASSCYNDFFCRPRFSDRWSSLRIPTSCRQRKRPRKSACSLGIGGEGRECHSKLRGQTACELCLHQ